MLALYRIDPGKWLKSRIYFTIFSKIMLRKVRRKTSMKKMFFGVLCVTFLCISFICYGAGDAEKPPPKATDPYRFAFLTNTLNNTYQSTMADTLKRLATSHGDSYLALDP